MKNIVITGVSTGIGYSSTKRLINHGYRVFGSVRNVEDAERLQIKFGDNYHPIIFDVVNKYQIKEAVNIEEEFIKKHLEPDLNISEIVKFESDDGGTYVGTMKNDKFHGTESVHAFSDTSNWNFDSIFGMYVVPQNRCLWPKLTKL